jgi:hypothetical protein
MQKNSFLTLALLAILFIIPACKNDHDHDDDAIVGFGSVEIEFENQADGSPLVFGKDYTNAAGESLQFTLFNYYISNVVLIKDDGTRFVVPKDKSYFLCKHDEPSTRKFTINDVPAGDYTGLEFMVGVDSAKSVSPIAERTGVLDPATGASGHYWSWNAGYIFMKMEGTSPAAPAPDNIFQYHIGLFGGFNNPTINNLKTIQLTVPGSAAKVREDHAPHFHLFVDALEVFKSPNTLSIAANPVTHGNPFSANIANNYADMFVIDHVHN